MYSLFTQWHLDGGMALFLIGLCAGYFMMNGWAITKKSGYFFAGWLLLIFSVASPLSFLGENYLMSAHMVSHVMILLIAAPLLVKSIPEHLSGGFLKRPSAFLIQHPWIPWVTGVSMMWFWHVPLLFNNLFAIPDPSSGLHFHWINVWRDLHLISLVLAGILFSWPVIAPDISRRIQPLNAVLYLTAACIFCSILGLLITFAPAGVYTPYMHINDHYGYLNMIRNTGGISQIVDQQLAGLIMWVPGCLIYLSGSMYLLMKWFREKNQKQYFVNHNAEP